MSTLIEDLYRLLTWGLYCIHGSKSIDLNESLADIDEFSSLFVCLWVVLQSGYIFAEDLNVINKKHKWKCS